MEFTVPKFIEKEAKIIGPLTFKQFLCLVIPGATVFIAYYTLPVAITIFLAIILMGMGLAFAFYKPGGRSFPLVMKNFVTFYPSSKLYVWKIKNIPPKIIKKEKTEEKNKKETVVSPTITNSKLGNLASKIDTYGGINQ